MMVGFFYNIKFQVQIWHNIRIFFLIFGKMIQTLNDMTIIFKVIDIWTLMELKFCELTYIQYIGQ